MVNIALVAEQLVALRFAAASQLANAAESETFTMINALVALAKQAAGIDIDATIPLSLPMPPDSPPFLEELVPGATGIPAGADVVIWARSIDRASQILQEGVTRLYAQFSGFSALPTTQFNGLLRRELNQHAWHLADIARMQTSKGFEITAEFAKIVVEKVSAWSLSVIEADLKNATTTAELLLKQAEVEINELLAKAGLEHTGYVSAGETAAHLAAAAMQGVSASASIAVSGNEESGISSETGTTKVTRQSTSVETIAHEENINVHIKDNT